MYFESVLSYLATLINDISLMNFAGHLTDPLIISLNSWTVFRQGRIAPRFLFNHSFISIFFYSVNKLRLVTPVLFGTAKVEIFFCFANLFETLFHLPFSLSPFLRSGMQKQEISATTQTFPHYFLQNIPNSLNHNQKNQKDLFKIL